MDIKDILTLSDKRRYVIASKTNYEEKDYLYLVDLADNKNIKFCYLDNDEIVIVSDIKLIEKLLPLLLKEMKSVLNDI